MKPELDFSEFHPLDHDPFTVECRTHKGGSVRHLRLAWGFLWWPGIRGVAYRVLCPLGKHYWLRASRARDPDVAETFWACDHCDARKPRLPDEWDGVRWP